MKKKLCLLIKIKRKKPFIPSSEMKCPKSGIFTWVVWSGKAILEDSSFSGAVEKFVGQIWLSPLEKIGLQWPRTPMTAGITCKPHT